jgi:serine/threonine-protein kinase
VNTYVAWVYHYSRDFDRCIQECLHTLDLSANHAEARNLMGLSYKQKGMHAEAIAECASAQMLAGSNPLVMASLAACYGEAGRRADALAVLDKLETLSQTRYVAPIALAIAHVGLGSADRAFEYLGKAIDMCDGLIHYLCVFPLYDPIREDPRFAPILEKLTRPAEARTLTAALGLSHTKTTSTAPYRSDAI